MRIGHGFDAHTFTEGRPLVLGGVTIPHDKGLKAHSDGDAVIHALCDAILGAAGLGDIGTYYPDTDKKFENIDSRILLRDVINSISQKGYKIGNADITILAQAPKLLSHIPDMKKFLSDDMNIQLDEVNVKATTTEGMG
ncbi:MAG: 2-C-methyl-D-erythritol 2,4-cyclodiphosphate synthase, partial [Gammaproteobacteria bacterium]